MTDGFRVERLSYNSPFYIVFSSITAATTSAAFAIANLYGRVQDLRVQRAEADIRVEVLRQTLNALKADQDEQAELTKSAKDLGNERKRIKVITTVNRAAEIVAKADDIHVERQ
ncbi:hypothetical protein [Mycobacterium sp. SP-6446]|uniref:hypothetical protein n=1 Tax=Mycobacterium sp. SP-6446 TaxID=1834162 RepID=UPI00096DBBFC|nr:hypothetical protein [Mycobacterium sp. SP-6446]OMC15791.1 hypothetical protein A5736_01455 [Mycobacterium sp. SP-6446]